MFVKYLLSLLLFLTILIEPFAFVGFIEEVVYVGIIVPLLFQKIWFGYWINYSDYKNFCFNILFSIFFILSSFGINIFLEMGGLINNATEIDLFTLILIIFNRLLFFFAILYLWNSYLFENKNKILYYFFRFLQVFYTIIAIPIIILMLYLIFLYNITPVD